MKILFLAILVVISFDCSSQELKEYYDSVYRLHISFPAQWGTAYCHLSCDGFGDNDVSKSIFMSLTTEQLHNYCKVTALISHVTDAKNYIKKTDSFSSKIYKSFTTSHTPGNQQISASYLGRDNYTASEQLEQYYHKGTGIDTFIHARMIFIHNDDIFELYFACLKSQYEKCLPLFLDIANSVYFD